MSTKCPVDLVKDMNTLNNKLFPEMKVRVLGPDICYKMNYHKLLEGVLEYFKVITVLSILQIVCLNLYIQAGISWELEQCGTLVSVRHVL